MPSFNAKRYARDCSPNPLRAAAATGSAEGWEYPQGNVRVSASSSSLPHRSALAKNGSASGRLPLYPGESVSARGGRGSNTSGEIGKDSVQGVGLIQRQAEEQLDIQVALE